MASTLSIYVTPFLNNKKPALSILKIFSYWFHLPSFNQYQVLTLATATQILTTQIASLCGPARPYDLNWNFGPCPTGQLANSSHSAYLAKIFALIVNSLLGKFIKLFNICL